LVANSKNIFLASPNKFVYAIDLLLGTTNWKNENFNSGETISISNDSTKLFLKSQSDKFIIASANDGKLIKEINLKFGFDLMPNQIAEVNGNILIGGKNGTVYLIDKNYKSTPLMFLGTSRINSLIHLKENFFAASNIDGSVVVFGL